MENIERIYIDNVSVIIINLTCATVYDAKEFRKIIDEEINSGYKRFIIDLSKCEKIGSMFFGAIVGTLNKIKDIGGKLKIVEPENPKKDIFTNTDTRNLFDIYKTSVDAMKKYEGDFST